MYYTRIFLFVKFSGGYAVRFRDSVQGMRGWFL